VNEQYDATLDLYLDGERADDLGGQLKFVEIIEHSQQASSFRMAFTLGTRDDNQWDLLSDARLILLRRITLAVRLSPVSGTTESFSATLLDGYITAVAPELSPTRYSRAKVVVEGLDGFALLHVDERNRAWNNTTDTGIASAIFREYGLGIDVDADTPARRDDRAAFLQRCTDAELLRVLARRNGFCLYLEPLERPVRAGATAQDDVVGHFHLPRLSLPAQKPISLRPGETAQTLRFDARWTALAPTVVAGTHIDERTRRVWAQELAQTKLPRQGTHGRAELLAPRLAAAVPTRPGMRARSRAGGDVPHEARDLESITWATMLEADWLAQAQATVDGLRYPGVLRARRPLDIQDGGAVLNGPWWVRSARHRLAWDAVPRTYEVELDLVRNALGGVA
jgi:hypothetical protein